ncbi:hypothetical protein RRG08_007497, partial [Elysia crispata]
MVSVLPQPLPRPNR